MTASENPKNSAQKFMRTTLSYVRRGGRMTSSQETAWNNYGDKYLLHVERDRLDTSIAAGQRLTPQEIFGREAPFIVEIGTGMGDAILYAATEHPEQNFLGVEVYRAGLAKTMLNAANLQLENLRLIEANAPDVFSVLLPEQSVAEVRIFFPDPWHKAKHNKRRLVSPGFTQQLFRSLVPGGIVRLATDWQDYADQMREVFDEAQGFERNFTGDWDERFAGRPLTAFENKGINKGRTIRDLSYVKTA